MSNFLRFSTQNRFLSNSVISIADQVLGLFLGLFITTMLARHFGPATLGSYTLALALTSLVSVLTNFGIQTAVKRSVARDNGSTGFQIGQSIIIRCSISLPSSLVLVHMLAEAMQYSYELILLCHFVNLWIFASGLFALISSILVSLHLNRVLLWFNLVYRLSNLGLLSMVVYHDQALESYVICLTIITLFVFFCGVRWASKLTQPVVWKPDWSFIFRLLVTSAPLTIAAAVEFANLKIDSLILGYYQPTEEVGFYAAAFNIALALTMLPLAVTKVFFPNFIDSFYNDGKKKAVRLFINVFGLFSLYGIASVVLIYFFSDVFVETLFGDDYSRTASVLIILGISVPVIVLNRLTNYVLIALNFDVGFFYVTLSGLLLNVILNISLIPEYSLYGAAVATICSELLVLGLGLLILTYNLKSKVKIYE